MCYNAVTTIPSIQRGLRSNPAARGKERRVAADFRIAVAGTGFGEKYITGLKGVSGVEVVGVYSRRPERAAATAEQFGIPYSTRHLDVLLELPNLHAVAIVTPNSTHAEFVRAALAGRQRLMRERPLGLSGIICDKPLALTAQEGTDLYRQAEDAGVRHVTFVPYRYSPASLAMKEAMAQGQIGRVLRVRANWGVDLRREPLRWRFQSSAAGPGVVADLGAHVLDLVTWWVGPIRRVLGRCRTLVPERPAEVGGRLRPVDVPDECWALVEFAGAGIGSVALSWNEQRPQRIEIEGERGTLIYESPSLLQWLEGRGPFNPSATLVHAGEAGRKAALPLPGRQAFTSPEAALAHIFGEIVSYLQGGERPEPVATFREGVEVLQVMDAIVASDREGRWLDAAAG